MNAKTTLSVLLLIACLTGLSRANKVTSCYSCYGINCQRTSLQKEQNCLDLLDYCVTIFDDSSRVLYKGCSLQIPVTLRKLCDSPNQNSCFKCNSDRCNNVGSAKFACVQCDSSKDTSCAEHADILKPVACNAPTAQNSYCFVNTSGSNIQRGCATTLADQQNCLRNTNCQLCSPGDIRSCNSVDIAKDSFASFISFLR